MSAASCCSACTGHFSMVPLNLTCLHCLQHSLFEHLFNLYYDLFAIQKEPEGSTKGCFKNLRNSAFIVHRFTNLTFYVNTFLSN